jgi:hypothetical protein
MRNRRMAGRRGERRRLCSDAVSSRGAIRRNGGRDELRIGDTTRASQGGRLLARRRSLLGAELGVRHVTYVESVPTEFRELQVRVRNVAAGADRRVYRASRRCERGERHAADVHPATQGALWARTNVGSHAGKRAALHGAGHGAAGFTRRPEGRPCRPVAAGTLWSWPPATD